MPAISKRLALMGTRDEGLNNQDSFRLSQRERKKRHEGPTTTNELDKAELRMGKVVVELTMSWMASLPDRNDGPEHPLGYGTVKGYFNWYFSGNTPSQGATRCSSPRARTRGLSMRCSRAPFCLSEWKKDLRHHARVERHSTHQRRAGRRANTPHVRLTCQRANRSFTFVADDIERAVELAKDAAGAKNVGVSAKCRSAVHSERTRR